MSKSFSEFYAENKKIVEKLFQKYSQQWAVYDPYQVWNYSESKPEEIAEHSIEFYFTKKEALNRIAELYADGGILDYHPELINLKLEVELFELIAVVKR